MNSILKSTLIILCLLMGCVPLKLGPISMEKMNPNGRVGVVSILGDEITMAYVGPTAFNNFTEKIVLQDWNLDKFVIELFSDELIKNTKMKPFPLVYDSKPLLEVYDSGFVSKDVSIELTRIAKENGLDLLIFVKSFSWEDPVSHSHYISGYGVFQRSIVFVKSSALYVYANAQAYDGKTMELLGEFFVYKSNEIKNDYFDRNFLKLDREKRDFILTWIKDSIREQVKIGLGRLAIIPENKPEDQEQPLHN